MLKFLSNVILQIRALLLKAKQFDIKQDFELGKYVENYSRQSILFKGWRPQNQLIATIYEHSDKVSCLELVKESKLFASAGYDGYLRIFDIDKIELEFMQDSIASIKCEGDENLGQQKKQKIKCMSMLESSCSILFGTDKGIIELNRVHTSYYFSKSMNKSRLFSKEVKSESKNEIQSISSFKAYESLGGENCFIYVTDKGTIGVQDIRAANEALTLRLGKTRGLITKLLLQQNRYIAHIGTLNGYLLQYDLRMNLLSNFFYLTPPSQHKGIISLQSYFFPGVETEYTALTYASDMHEMAVFDLQSLEDNMNPLLYFRSVVGQQDKELVLPFLSNRRRQEQCSNFNSKMKRGIGDLNELVQYLSDPLVTQQWSLNEQWLINSKSSYSNLSQIFQCNGTANRVICFPSVNSQYSSIQIGTSGLFFSAGNDRNIRWWQVNGEQGKRITKGGLVNCVDGVERYYQQNKYADQVIVEEIETKENGENNKIDKRIGHNDVINDLLLIDRDRTALLVTCSRDNTIKIWK